MKELVEQLSQFYSNGKFSDEFIQTFVETTNRTNYHLLNDYFKTKYSHSELNKAIESIAGNKLIKFTEAEEDLEKVESFLQDNYKFGKYENARYWIINMASRGVIANRSTVLGWIAKQRPEKQNSSFSPAHDKNLYHSSEFITE